MSDEEETGMGMIIEVNIAKVPTTEQNRITNKNQKRTNQSKVASNRKNKMIDGRKERKKERKKEGKKESKQTQHYSTVSNRDMLL